MFQHSRPRNENLSDLAETNKTTENKSNNNKIIIIIIRRRTDIQKTYTSLTLNVSDDFCIAINPCGYYQNEWVTTGSCCDRIH